MKVKCPISGVTYQTSLPSNGFTIHPHPIFSVPATKLITTYLEDWSAGSLSSEETHLLGLALISKLPIAILPSLSQDSAMLFNPFWQRHMEKIAKLVTRLEGKSFSSLPKLAISEENLANLPHWIETLHTEVSILFSPISEEAKKRNKAFYVNMILGDDTNPLAGLDSADIDALMLRGLKGGSLSSRESKAFPSLIASWAANVGEFPQAYVTLESGKKLTISKHWQSIIIKAFQKEGIYSILSEEVTLADIEELLEHCYTEIPVGTIHASELFKKLEYIKEILEEFRQDSKPKPAVPKFKGSHDDMVSLLCEDSPSDEPKRVTNASKILAERLAAIRGKKS